MRFSIGFRIQAQIRSPRNCGACWHDCEGGACVDGVCQPYALGHVVGNGLPSGLSIPGDGQVYFGDYVLQTVNRIADGVPEQTAPTVLTSAPTYCHGLLDVVADASSLYFSCATNHDWWIFQFWSGYSTQNAPTCRTAAIANYQQGSRGADK